MVVYHAFITAHGVDEGEWAKDSRKNMGKEEKLTLLLVPWPLYEKPLSLGILKVLFLFLGIH